MYTKMLQAVQGRQLLTGIQYYIFIVSALELLWKINTEI
jgi:hypothetical protein